MESNRRIEPGSAARAAESEPRLAVKRIEGGSAAKAAEENARIADNNFQRAIGLNLRVSTGRKFDLPDRPQMSGEALPVAKTEEKPSGAQVAGSQETSSSDASVKNTTGKLPGVFRRLFRL